MHLVDCENALDVKLIRALWIHFRLTDGVSLSRYPKVSHLVDTMTPVQMLELADSYLFIASLFRTFIHGENTVRRLVFRSNSTGEHMLTFFKNRSDFMNYMTVDDRALLSEGCPIKAALEKEFEIVATKVGHGHAYIIAMADCDQV